MANQVPNYLILQNCEALQIPELIGSQEHAFYQNQLKSCKTPIYIKVINPPSHHNEHICVWPDFPPSGGHNREFQSLVEPIPSEKACWIINPNQHINIYFYIQVFQPNHVERVEMKIVEISPDWAYYVETKSNLVENEYIQFLVWKVPTT